MRRVLLVTAAVVAAVIFFALATLPPRPQAVDAGSMDPDLVRRTVRGAYHVHTSRSDGAADKAAIAASASRAGLQFVIFTDHGDGTASPEAPAYASGVLCIDGVELSTNGGHYVALGMRPSPYPLGGDPSAVVEDVSRLGGFGIAAHPDSPKASLAWTDWDAPIDGIEWLSADSEWRDESRPMLVHALFSYPIRPGPALASMLDRPVATLKRWDELSQHRPVVGLAAHDAHGGIGRGMEESGERKPALGHVPSYEASFRMFSDYAILDAPLTGSPDGDASRVLDAIRHGRVFTVIDALASPGYVDLRGSQAELASATNMGSVFTSGLRVVSVKVTLPARAETVVIDQGVEAHRVPRDSFTMGMEPMATGSVRVEVRLPGSPGTPPVPWLVSNPLYSLGRPAPRPSVSAAGPVDPVPADAGWHVEKDSRSTAGLSEAGGKVSVEYTLAAGAKASQFVALAADLNGGLVKARRLLTSASADYPSRLSVQLRYKQGGGERWGISVYLDSTPREIVVPLDRMRPLDRQSGPPPDPATASSLLFVVDLTNAKPGTSNRFTVGNVRIAR